MPQDNPPLLDKTMNTTESTPRNLADVLASGLANIANNVKPDGSDISINVPGMSANNVNDGFIELKGTLDDIGLNDYDDFTLTNTTQNQWTDLGSITLSAGTYYVNSILWLDDAFSGVYNHRVMIDSVNSWIIRNTGANGGGSCLSKIFVLTATTTIKLLVYTPIATKATGLIESVRIK